jgi:uncharacterized protein YlxW (UPF0749 family)
MKKRKQRQIVYLSLLALLVGLLISFGFSANATPGIQGQSQSRRDELITAITTIEQEIAQLEIERRLINERINEIRLQEADSEARVGLLSHNLEEISQIAAQTELEGPGLIITISDNRDGAFRAQALIPETFNPDFFIVHDKDLLYLLSSLAPLSEGIAINHLRLHDNFTIRCVGTVILINNHIVAPPFEIRLIGNPDLLLEALENSSRFHYLLFRQLPIQAIQSDAVLLPAFGGSLPPSHSQPLR